MIKKLQKNHKLLCTSRNYREVVELAKIRGLNLIFIGKHGGFVKFDKLNSSIQRMNHLLKIIEKFSPELTISFCSPEAARISFGLGIRHISFCDSPHADAVMRLTIPLVNRLLIPWLIPKEEFTKYGIAKEKITHYRAIDASLIVKQRPKVNLKINFLLEGKKTILIRPEESEASYVTNNEDMTFKIIREIKKEFQNYNIVVLGRYTTQIKKLKHKFGKNVIVMDNVVDGKSLLSLADLFIGSGGTMTAEAALMGVPTISFNAVPNYMEEYLVKNGLVKRAENPKEISYLAKLVLRSDTIRHKEKARRILNSMEDPFSKLVVHIKPSIRNI